MKYQLIFTDGYTDDTESISRELRADILILDKMDNYYNPTFITLNRIKVEFESDQICFLDDNIVILHSVTKENILKSVKELHKWQFFKRWIPLSSSQLEKYFFPPDEWLTMDIFIE